MHAWAKRLSLGAAGRVAEPDRGWRDEPSDWGAVIDWMEGSVGSEVRESNEPSECSGLSEWSELSAEYDEDLWYKDEIGGRVMPSLTSPEAKEADGRGEFGWDLRLPDEGEI